MDDWVNYDNGLDNFEGLYEEVREALVSDRSTKGSSDNTAQITPDKVVERGLGGVKSTNKTGGTAGGTGGANGTNGTNGSGNEPDDPNNNNRKGGKKKKEKAKKKRSKLRIFLKVLSIFCLSIVIICGIAAAVVWIKIQPIVNGAMQVAYDKMVDIDESSFMRLKDTEIYDKNDNKIGEINIGNYQYTKINDISKFIQDGYIAVEDKNFATHNGIDPKAILRAGLALIENDGEITQGGSTITQQVLKNNVIGTDINKWERKVIEIFLAPEFEKSFTKKDIMEFYCNSNFYQNNCYGVETAAQYYFGKSAANVTLAEAAGLVGLSNNPAAYNPVKHMDAFIEKRHFVLTKMLENGAITQEQFDEADKEEVNLVLARDERIKETYTVSFALHCAALELMKEDNFIFKYKFATKEEYDEYLEEYDEAYSNASNEIRSGGYKIYTSFDMELQKQLQEAVDAETSPYTKKAEDGRFLLQGAATLVDNATGHVIAMVGGRGTDDEYNRGYQAARQPGSSIKPLVVYGPAFETGRYYPSLKIKDEPIENGPKNAGGGYRGWTSIREAIGRSLNTIPYKILQDIKPSTGVGYLQAMKFSHLSYLDQFNGSMALGGFTYGTTTFEMAKGYACLSQYGEYIDNNCLRKIEYQDGRTVYECAYKSYTVFSQDTCYMLMDCLKGVLEAPYGTGHLAKVKGHTIAGKTGTTNSNKDMWFCGFNQKYSMAVWIGYDQPREMNSLPNMPAKIFSKYMSNLLKDDEDADFERPDTIYDSYVDGKGLEVDYRTGVKDIFSKAATERLEEEQKEAEERQRKEAEVRAQKAEEALIKSLNTDIENFGKLKIDTKEDVAYMENQYERIVEQINSINSFETRESLMAELKSSYEAYGKLSYIQKYKKQLAEEERILKEEAEKRKQEEEERNQKLKEARLEAATQAVKNLEYWSTSNYKDLLAVAEMTLELCEEYPEYGTLYGKYENIRGQIDLYFQKIEVPVVPDLTPTETLPRKPLPWETSEPQPDQSQEQQEQQQLDPEPTLPDEQPAPDNTDEPVLDTDNWE